MKRAIILLTVLTAMAVTAAAQPGPPPPPRRGDVLADYLQLNDAQKSAWKSARSDFEAAVKPLHDQQRAAHEQIEQLMSGANPDPAAVGKLMVSIKAIGDQIKAAHDALETKLGATLTTEQKAKFQAFEAAREFLQQRGPRPDAGPGQRPGPPR